MAYDGARTVNIFAIVQSTVSDLLKDSNPLELEWKSPGSSSSLKYCRRRGWNCCPLAWELGTLPLDQLDLLLSYCILFSKEWGLLAGLTILCTYSEKMLVTDNKYIWKYPLLSIFHFRYWWISCFYYRQHYSHCHEYFCAWLAWNYGYQTTTVSFYFCCNKRQVWLFFKEIVSL